jgi:nucleotide-binding universal stress UspA family protein
MTTEPPTAPQGDVAMEHAILVPLDGSPAAEHALTWASSIAQQNGSPLQLVRVHVPPAPLMVGSELASDVMLDAAIRKIESTYLEEMAARLGKAVTIPVHQSLLEGATADAIDDHAKAVKADLIVITSHGRGAFARFWLGSVADKIIRHAPAPILVVRPVDDQAPNLSDRPAIQRLVIPLDGSLLAERIIEPAIKLGKTFGAEYSLVLILEAVENIETLSEMKAKIPGGWMPEATQKKAETYLEKVAHHMRGHSVIVHTKVIPHGSAAAGILDYSKTHGRPVIALATHGRSGLKRLILGSVADKIIRGATMPVLIYHPAEPK